MQLAGISVAEIANEIRFPGSPLKKRGIHLGIVKARHRPAVKPERAGGNYEVSALQRPIAKSRGFDERLIAGKP
jgi:hypothetical protein